MASGFFKKVSSLKAVWWGQRLARGASVMLCFINKQHLLRRTGRTPSWILPHSCHPLCDRKKPGNSSHVSKSYRGISLWSCPFSSIPPHISESFSFVSPGNRSTFFKLSSKEKKKKKRRGRSPLHVLLCPLITHLSLKQMADHLPVYISAPWFERGSPEIRISWIVNHRNKDLSL